MRGWAVRGVGAAVLAALVGAGCGSDTNGAPPEPPDAVSPVPPGPPDNPLPGAGVPLPPLDASTVAFEVPACVSLGAPTGPRHASPCEVRSRRANGSLAKVERFDAEGHPLESLDYTDGGEVWTRTVHTWTQGREVLRESESATGAWREQAWVYDAAGRPVWEVTREGPEELPERELRRFYDAQGRLSRTELREGKAQSPWVTGYTYDIQSRLESVEWGDGQGYVSYTERYTYRPDGVLQRFVAEPFDGPGLSVRREYDEAGRLLQQQHCSGGCSEETREYGPHGEPTRIRSTSSGVFEERAGDQLLVYDASGRLVVDVSVVNVAWSDWRERGQYRELRRRVLACETGDVLSEEWDTGADGTREGWTELERDPAGNLRVERFFGTKATPSLGSREYDYSCH